MKDNHSRAIDEVNNLLIMLCQNEVEATSNMRKAKQKNVYSNLLFGKDWDTVINAIKTSKIPMVEWEDFASECIYLGISGDVLEYRIKPQYLLAEEEYSKLSEFDLFFDERRKWLDRIGLGDLTNHMSDKEVVAFSFIVKKLMVVKHKTLKEAVVETGYVMYQTHINVLRARLAEGSELILAKAADIHNRLKRKKMNDLIQHPTIKALFN